MGNGSEPHSFHDNPCLLYEWRMAYHCGAEATHNGAWHSVPHTACFLFSYLPAVQGGGEIGSCGAYDLYFLFPLFPSFPLAGDEKPVPYWHSGNERGNVLFALANSDNILYQPDKHRCPRHKGVLHDNDNVRHSVQYEHSAGR